MVGWLPLVPHLFLHPCGQMQLWPHGDDGGKRAWEAAPQGAAFGSHGKASQTPAPQVVQAASLCQYGSWWGCHMDWTIDMIQVKNKPPAQNEAKPMIVVFNLDLFADVLCRSASQIVVLEYEGGAGMQRGYGNKRLRTERM